MKHILLLLTCSLIFACTSVNVKPLDSSLEVTHIGIKRNPKVIVEDFLPLMRQKFKEHGITTEVFDESAPENCSVIATYTALQSWDFSTYLSHAEISLTNRDFKEVASAEYHLIGKGGLSFMKWQSVETKMSPVIDELLVQY